MADFSSWQHVTQWVADNEPDGVNKLRNALNTGAIGPLHEKMGRAWLADADLKASEAERKRNAEATERAVEAARRSAFWTAIAAIAAAVGAVVTALQPLIAMMC